MWYLFYSEYHQVYLFQLIALDELIQSHTFSRSAYSYPRFVVSCFRRESRRRTLLILQVKVCYNSQPKNINMAYE